MNQTRWCVAESFEEMLRAHRQRQTQRQFHQLMEQLSGANVLGLGTTRSGKTLLTSFLLEDDFRRQRCSIVLAYPCHLETLSAVVALAKRVNADLPVRIVSPFVENFQHYSRTLQSFGIDKDLAVSALYVPSELEKLPLWVQKPGIIVVEFASLFRASVPESLLNVVFNTLRHVNVTETQPSLAIHAENLRFGLNVLAPTIDLPEFAELCRSRGWVLRLTECTHRDLPFSVSLLANEFRYRVVFQPSGAAGQELCEALLQRPSRSFQDLLQHRGPRSRQRSLLCQDTSLSEQPLTIYDFPSH